eukprot:c25005_g1_i1 orf=481-729(-)
MSIMVKTSHQPNSLPNTPIQDYFRKSKPNPNDHHNMDEQDNLSLSTSCTHLALLSTSVRDSNNMTVSLRASIHTPLITILRL